MDRAEYEALFRANQRLTGRGAETTMHLPCTFCAAADFLVYRLLDVESALQKDTTCGACGRGRRAIVSAEGDGKRFECVQTRGEPPPDYVPAMRREGPCPCCERGHVGCQFESLTPAPFNREAPGPSRCQECRHVLGKVEIDGPVALARAFRNAPRPAEEKPLMALQAAVDALDAMKVWNRWILPAKQRAGIMGEADNDPAEQAAVAKYKGALAKAAALGVTPSPTPGADE